MYNVGWDEITRKSFKQISVFVWIIVLGWFFLCLFFEGSFFFCFLLCLLDCHDISKKYTMHKIHRYTQNCTQSELYRVNVPCVIHCLLSFVREDLNDTNLHCESKSYLGAVNAIYIVCKTAIKDNLQCPLIHLPFSIPH